MSTNGFYLDTEFIECAKQRTFLGFPIGQPVDTIDLISLALVSADGRRELYMLNSECELEYAWANEWVRDNVLQAIYEEMLPDAARQHIEFTLDTMRAIFVDKGTSRADIAQEVLRFLFPSTYLAGWLNASNPATPHAVTPFGLDEVMVGMGTYLTRAEVLEQLLEAGYDPTPTFYTYYGAYDWVVFCQALFGRMNDLPAGLPMYAVDLKQEQDRLKISKEDKRFLCPDPTDEHNALADAHWNRHWHLTLGVYDPTYSLAVNRARARACIGEYTLSDQPAPRLSQLKPQQAQA